METNYDVMIVGTGIAGLYGALNLDPNLRVLLLSKRDFSLSNSSLAQGGIAAVFNKENDNINYHMNDTLTAGGFKNNTEAIRQLVTDGPVDVQRLIDYGVDFDRTPDGNIHLTLEGGHSRSRILHHKDSTGNEIVHKLLGEVRKLNNVTMVENAIVCDLKNPKHGFSADVLIDGEHVTMNAHYCLLATGGIGRVYKYTTNSAIATGEGIAMAYRLGAKIKDLSLVQFHPTAFANVKTRECFLISESVRGEGAYLLNCNHERFMHRYDPRLELAPRDVVSMSIIQESRLTGSENFYLDISHKGSDFVKNRFPMIYCNLKKQGFDMAQDCIPVFPCQHYLMGGIDVDLSSRTTIDGLYAAGECAHTGVHGNNRLASNSLLEALVFSRRAAEDINGRFLAGSLPALTPYEFPDDNATETLPKGIRTEVRAIMQRAHFVIPDKAAALEGFERLQELHRQIEAGHYKITPDYVLARSLTTVAYLMLREMI